MENNRDTRNNGWGKYSADRFLEIWYSSKKLPLGYERGRFYAKRFGLNSHHWMDVIDQELIELGLIEFTDSPRGYKAVIPIRNRRNYFVAKFTEWYLITFIGDNPQYYRDMEEEAKRNDI